ncbi:MAG: hypothetical protein CL777_03400 [Chloroflexi bacterium]|nr:hypothetical protein [Chloroflexota bacterium]
MISVRQLLELQAIDMQIDTHTNRLQDISVLLGDDRIIRALKQRILELQEKISQKKSEQIDIDALVDGVSLKVTQAEKKLYSGTVVNSRELQDLQAEITMLKGHQNDAENSLLVILEEIDSLQNSNDTYGKKLKFIETEWNEKQTALLSEKANIEDDVSKEQSLRNSVSTAIPSIEINLYEQVRRLRPDTPVAKMENGLCNFCKVGLPMKLQQEVRASLLIQKCPTCGRILVS